MVLENVTNTRSGAQGINEPIHSYSAALGACEFGTMQDKMLRDQLAEKSSVLCIWEQLLFKRKTNSGPI